jgi:hypothetical protein
MKPYVPIFSSTPARITEPAVGASTCASGSHVCSGTIGTLIANDRPKAASRIACTSSGRLLRYEVGEGEGGDARRGVERHHEVDQRGEHQDAAEGGVEHELERGVDAAAPRPRCR